MSATGGKQARRRLCGATLSEKGGPQMIVRDAQQELGRAFVGGGPGVIISGLMWLAAALVQQSNGTPAAFAVLFFSGMLIFPLALLVCGTLFRRERASPDNPLGRVALESTIAMIGGLFAARLFLPVQPDYVFPVAAIAVGTHYAAFRTVYGDPLFWLLAALITGIGFLDIYDLLRVPNLSVLAVGPIELVFGVVLTMRALRKFEREPSAA
jgi:hypothetical protein